MSLRVRVQAVAGPTADYPLDGGELLVGRATSCAIVVLDSRVSRQHARFVRREGGWWIEDLGARNRALLNGAPLVEPQPINAGDRVEIGDAILRIVDDAASEPGATATRPHAADAARLWTINEIHRALAASLGLSDLLEVILARCFDVLDPEEGLIMLRGRDGQLETAASRRRGAKTPVVVPRRLVDEVVGKAQPALVLDAAYDERFAGSESMVSSGFRSVVAAPIVDAEGTLGLIALCSRVAVRRFAPPDLDMLVSIASAAALRVRNVALLDELASKRVVEHELALAHDVQMAMLPRSMPAFPGLAVAARLKPARSVGGDLYDVLLDDTRLWFIVADVAGKSIAAALYMAITKTLFRATARGATEVSHVVARMNDELARDNERMMFVTAVVGCLDLASGALSLIDAGHNPALLADGDGVREVPAVAKGPALGVVENAVYAAAAVTLAPSQTLVLYTDGLTDARCATGEMFGDERVRAAIAAGGLAPDALVASVVAAVDRFEAGTPAEDDVTLLALRFARG